GLAQPAGSGRLSAPPVCGTFGSLRMSGFFGSWEEALGLLFEDSDEGFAHDLALLLGVGDAGEVADEALGGVDVDEVDGQMAVEGVDDALRLFFAEEAVVDEDAGELVADGFVDQRGGDGGVDAAGEGADDAARADLGTDPFDGVIDEVGGGPVAATAGHLVEEVLEDR